MACIRFASEADAAEISSIYAPYVRDKPTSFEAEPPSREEMAARILKILQTHPWLVAEIGGSVAGYAYASEHRPREGYRWCVDVAIYVHAEHRRQNLARRLYSELFAILRAQRFYNAYAGIALPNPASVGLHESLGFRPVGVYRSVGFKLGSWHDVGWWGFDLQPKPSEPLPPLKVGEVLDPADWSRSLV